MGFTTISMSTGGLTLVMDAAFFARTLTLDEGTLGADYRLGIPKDQPGWAGQFLSIGPYPTATPPFGPGLVDLFSDGTAELVQLVYAPSSEPDGIHWLVNYYSLDPAEAVAVGSLSIDLVPGAPTWLHFGYLPGQTSPVLHVNDFAPAPTTPLTYYDREAANRIEARDGDDVLLGFGGNDTILGGEGADWIDGGAGNDLLFAHVDSTALGDGVVDVLKGGDGLDTLLGDNDADNLSGDAGNDLLQGKAGPDTMNGGKGNDTLLGGNGADLLTGGKGRDTFRYENWLTEGGDKIKDFVAADDQVAVSAGWFGGVLVAGMDVSATGQFLANLTGKATTPGLAQFVYDTDDGRLYWDIDGKGGAKAVLLATLTGVPTLTAADITVIA